MVQAAAGFAPVIEQCTEAYWRQLLPYPGYYFGLGSWDSQERRRGYIATLDSHEGFRECEFAIEELWALQKTLKAISIPLGSSVGVFDGGSGLIRVYHGREGWIDFFYSNIEQPQWNPLWAFIQQTTEQFLPSSASEIQGNFDDPPPENPQPRARGRKTPAAPPT
jgi:hypothetical protein